MADYQVHPLTNVTWGAFAALVERHNGVWGGRGSGRWVSDETPGEKSNASFLYNGTRSLFEQAGFAYEQPKGKNPV